MSLIESDRTLKFKLYNRRFGIIFFVSLALLMNGEMWISLASITQQLTHFFNKTSQDINWFSNVFLITLAIEAIPSVLFPEIFGIKGCVLIAGLLNTFGSILRVFIVYYSSLDPTFKYYICLIASVFPALAQGFILNLPPCISLRWFGEKERDTSTSVMYALNLFGVSIGFLFPYTIVMMLSRFPNDIYPLKIIFLSELIVNIISLIGSMIILKERPQTPPSRATENSIKCSNKLTKFKKMKLFITQTFKLAIHYKTACYLLTYGCYYASSTAFATFLMEMLYYYFTDPPVYTGLIGSFSIIAGSIFSFIFGFICSKYGPVAQKITGAVCSGLSGIVLVSIVILLTCCRPPIELILFLVIVYFIFSLPYNSIGIEQLANMTFPLEPQISTNGALIVSNIIGASIIYGLGHLDSSKKYIYSICISIALYSYCTFCILFIKYRTNRSEFDNQALQYANSSPLEE